MTTETQAPDPIGLTAYDFRLLADQVWPIGKGPDIADLTHFGALVEKAVTTPVQAPDGGDEPEPAAWLVTWKGGEHQYAHAHASEMPAVDQARIMGGKCEPLYRAAPAPQAAPADNNSMGQTRCYPAGEKTNAAPAEGDVWALVESYAAAKVDCAANPTHESAKAYAKLAESNLRDALAGFKAQPKGTAASSWVWTHKTKGGEYTHLGRAQLQTDAPLGDMAALVVYQGTNGGIWARAADEFADRFKRIPKLAATQAPAVKPEPVAPKPDRTGMTYYRKDGCPAASATAPDCICWSPSQPPVQPTGGV